MMQSAEYSKVNSNYSSTSEVSSVTSSLPTLLSPIKAEQQQISLHSTGFYLIASDIHGTLFIYSLDSKRLLAKFELQSKIISLMITDELELPENQTVAQSTNKNQKPRKTKKTLNKTNSLSNINQLTDSPSNTAVTTQNKILAMDHCYVAYLTDKGLFGYIDLFQEQYHKRINLTAQLGYYEFTHAHMKHKVSATSTSTSVKTVSQLQNSNSNSQRNIAQDTVTAMALNQKSINLTNLMLQELNTEMQHANAFLNLKMIISFILDLCLS